MTWQTEIGLSGGIGVSEGKSFLFPFLIYKSSLLSAKFKEMENGVMKFLSVIPV